MAEDWHNDEIEVVVNSVLPPDGPQGKFRVSVPGDVTVEALMRRVCREARVPLLPQYVLRNANNQVLPLSANLQRVEVINGSILHWEQEEVRTKTMTSWCSVWWFLCFISIVIGATGLVAISVVKSRELNVYSYGIVFDAGSSHTSMYIYRWNGAKLNETAVASQFGDPVTPKYPGISNFEDDPEQGRLMVSECLEAAKEKIPEDKWRTTPVYLGATAGMRMLREVNSTVSTEILKVIQDTASGFPFLSNSSDIRIISGEQEGAFSWITSNYISGVFHVRPTSNLLMTDGPPETTGALDLGGASAQISFIPTNTTVVPLGYHHDVDLFGRTYTLYTHSFLCYGINEALRRYQAALVQSQNFSATIDDPCAPKGWEQNITHSLIFQAPCVRGQHAMETFGSVIIVEAEDKKEFLFRGTGDEGKCQNAMVEHLFNFSAPCKYDRCSFNGAFQPPLSGEFYAFSTFYYVTNFLNLTNGMTQFNLTRFQDAITDFCNKTWDEVKVIPAAMNKTLPHYCFQSRFVDIILTKGYGFNETNWDSLHFVEKVSGTKVGWSLGLMLDKSNAIPAQVPQIPISTPTFILLVILFGVFILTAVGFACHARRYRDAKAHRRYSRLAEYGSI